MYFNYRGVFIKSELDFYQKQFSNNHGNGRNWIEKYTSTNCSIMDFALVDRELTCYLYIKSILWEFINSFGKRSGQEGLSTILEKFVYRTENDEKSGIDFDNDEILYFSSRQESGGRSLLIANLDSERIKYSESKKAKYEVFNLQEVKMLEDAFGKAVSLMGATLNHSDEEKYNEWTYERKIKLIAMTRYTTFTKKLNLKKFNIDLSQ